MDAINNEHKNKTFLFIFMITNNVCSFWLQRYNKYT